MQESATIQVQSVLQVNLLHVGIRGPANTYYFERVAVQVERMTQVGLLNCNLTRISDLLRNFLGAFTFVDEHHLNDGVQRDIDLVRTHAVRSTVRRAIVTVAKLFRINLIVLREEWCRRRQV